MEKRLFKKAEVETSVLRIKGVFSSGLMIQNLGESVEVPHLANFLCPKIWVSYDKSNELQSRKLGYKAKAVAKESKKTCKY